MRKVLIIQNIIPEYRHHFYECLSKHCRLTIIHSGAINRYGKDIKYAEVHVPVISLGAFYFQVGVNTFIKTHHYDVVVSMFDLHWINMTLSLFTNRKIKHLLWGHRYSENKIINKIKNLYIKKSSGVILYSAGHVEALKCSGIPSKKIFIAHNTVAIDNHEDCSKENKDSFIFVGRLQKRKRVDILIKAFSMIIKDIPNDINLIIIGDGEEYEKLKLMTIKLGLYERVNFIGKCHDNKFIKDCFKRSYAYVSPGSVGLSVLHSFSYGVPVITQRDQYHGPEFENILPEKNSIIYTTIYELSEIMSKICFDEKQIREYGRNAYGLYLNERSMSNMVHGFMDSIEEKDGL